MSAKRGYVFPLVLVGLLCAGCTTQQQQAKSGAPNQEEARLVSLASDIRKRGDNRTALPLLERAVKVSGNAPAANVRLGYARLDAKEPDAAASAFRAALEREPKNPSALLGLGTAQMQAGQVESAGRTLAIAAPLVKTPTAYNRLGTTLILTGDVAGSQNAFAEASRLAPANLDTRANLALSQALAGQFDAGIASIRTATASPLAEPRHFRDEMLILVLANRDRDAEAVTIPDYPTTDKLKFLNDARKVRSIKDPAGRARAIGLLAAVG